MADKGSTEPSFVDEVSKDKDQRTRRAAEAHGVNEDRATREFDGRDEDLYPENWAPPQMLPDPKPDDSFIYRWIRTSSLGSGDNTNVSRRFREGWRPVRAEDHPELKIESDIDSRFEGNVEVGGLLLCKIPRKLVEQRREHYRRLNDNAMRAVDESFMRVEDRRMPLLRPERKTRVSFGPE